MIDRSGAVSLGRRLYYALLGGIVVDVGILAILRILQQPGA